MKHIKLFKSISFANGAKISSPTLVCIQDGSAQKLITFKSNENDKLALIGNSLDQAEVRKLFGDVMDIVDWDVQTLTLNMNGYSSPSARTGWTISANGQNYTTANREADRTMVINTGAIDNCSSIAIEAKGTAGVIESCQLYTKPYIYISNKTFQSTTDGGDVWQKSGTLTISGSVTFGRVVIYPGAELVITDGNTLTCSELVLRTDAFSSAVFTNNGTLACDHVYYTRIIADKAQTYQIAFPFDVDVNTVKLSNGKTAPFGQTWGLNYYDAANRAANGITGQLNWKGCNPAAFSTMQANTGYQIQSASSYYMEFYFPVEIPEVIPNILVMKAYPSENQSDIGWNYFCSPFTCRATVKHADGTDAIIKDVNGNIFTILQPAMPYYYQNTTDHDITLVFIPAE